jgi:hypothetical protein
MHNVMQQGIMNLFVGKSGKNNKDIHIKIATKKAGKFWQRFNWKNNENRMMVKQGQTKQAVMIELVLVLILAYALTYSHMPNPVPAATHSAVIPLVEVQAPVPSWTFSAAPDTKPAQAKAKIPPRLVESTLVAEPVPSPIVAAAIHDVPEPAPVPVPKEATVPAPESAAAYVSKPVATHAPETVAEPALVPSSKEALVAAPEAETYPVPKVIPASVLSPAKALSSSPSSPDTPLVAGTAAALVLAPLVAPVAIIVGIAVSMFTPSASQLGQVAPAPKQKTGIVSNTGPSSDY